MLKEAMLAMRATDMEYAPDIRRLLRAGKRDLEIAGVQIQGDIDIQITEDPETGKITATDNSSIEDDLVITALITYACARGDYASAEERVKLDASYDLQRRQLANATGYTDFLEDEAETANTGSAGSDSLVGNSPEGESDTNESSETSGASAPSEGSAPIEDAEITGTEDEP